jgi:hypothetical protein
LLWAGSAPIDRIFLKTGKVGQELCAHEIYELSADEPLAIPGMREPDDEQGPKTVD